MASVTGPKPKPTAQKKLAGNPGRRPLPTSEPQYDVAASRAPIGLSEGALRFWREIAPELIAAKILTVVDIPAFLLMAEHYALARRAVRELAEADSLTIQDDNDLTRKSPLLQVVRDQAAAFRQFAVEFGITPSSRTRIHAPGGEQEKSLADELFGMIAAPAEVMTDGD